jgi:hypothetical protein
MSAGGKARYRRYNEPAVRDYEAMKKGVRTFLTRGATDVEREHEAFLGEPVRNFCQSRRAVWSVRAGIHNEESEQRRGHDDYERPVEH